MSTVKECDYRSVALVSIRSFAVVRVHVVRYFHTSTGSAFYLVLQLQTIGPGVS